MSCAFWPARTRWAIPQDRIRCGCACAEGPIRWRASGAAAASAGGTRCSPASTRKTSRTSSPRMSKKSAEAVAREENNLTEKWRWSAPPGGGAAAGRRGSVGLYGCASPPPRPALWVAHGVRYQSALGLMNDGKYEEARAAFSAMGDYRDAQAQLAVCDYEEALSLMEEGGVEALRQAEADLAAMEGYGDSADRLKEVTYALGEAYLAEGSYELAADRFQSLDGYRDSAERPGRPLYLQRQASATAQLTLWRAFCSRGWRTTAIRLTGRRRASIRRAGRLWRRAITQELNLLSPLGESTRTRRSWSPRAIMRWPRRSSPRGGTRRPGGCSSLRATTATLPRAPMTASIRRRWPPRRRVISDVDGAFFTPSLHRQRGTDRGLPLPAGAEPAGRRRLCRGAGADRPQRRAAGRGCPRALLRVQL